MAQKSGVELLDAPLASLDRRFAWVDAPLTSLDS